jgi:hypothetical protein
MRTSNKFIRRVSWRKQIRQWSMKWPPRRDRFPPRAKARTRRPTNSVNGRILYINSIGIFGGLEEAREPHFAKLVGLALEKCPWRIHASAQPTFSAIDLDLPNTRTKHQICVLDFGCCRNQEALGSTAFGGAAHAECPIRLLRGSTDREQVFPNRALPYGSIGDESRGRTWL